MSEEPPPDPLTTFIGRSLRAVVTEATLEIVRRATDEEADRVRFTQDGQRRSLVVKRVPPHASLEVNLLPHLARKTDRVPKVYARGIPPVTVAAWPWLLIEDLLDAPPAAGDLEGIIRAKVAIEQAVRADAPALVALGVPRIARHGSLAAWPEVLVHGALTRAHAVGVDRGVVIVEWRHASLGAGLLDVVRLARDAGVDPRPLAASYAAASDRTVDDVAVRAAADLL